MFLSLIQVYIYIYIYIDIYIYIYIYRSMFINYNMVEVPASGTGGYDQDKRGGKVRKLRRS